MEPADAVSEYLKEKVKHAERVECKLQHHLPITMLIWLLFKISSS